MIPRLALTPGEPAGIGPELVVRLAHHPDRPQAELVAYADRELLLASAESIGMDLPLREFDPDSPARATAAGELALVHVPLAHAARPGTLDPANRPAVLESLARASDACLAGHCHALVTGPSHKGILSVPGAPFFGHTEFFAMRARSDVLMLLVAPGLRVALATTHLPLSGVPGALTPDLLRRVLTLLHHGLQRDFGLAEPRLAVLGLNPHAGEGGHLGREEIDVIAPALDVLRAQGLRITGPLSADTAFVPTRRADFDAYLAMYHDQGLPVLKALGFGESVNVTLGLPYPRTSVDHGVALDVAGRGIADVQSLLAAAVLACELAQRHARTSAP